MKIEEFNFTLHAFNILQLHAYILFVFNNVQQAAVHAFINVFLFTKALMIFFHLLEEIVNLLIWCCFRENIFSDGKMKKKHYSVFVRSKNGTKKQPIFIDSKKMVNLVIYLNRDILCSSLSFWILEKFGIRFFLTVIRGASNRRLADVCNRISVTEVFHVSLFIY